YSLSPSRPSRPATDGRASAALGRTELAGFLVSAGWGTYGFAAAPIVGTTLAELIATGKTPTLIEPFALERFHTDPLVSELAAAAVSHVRLGGAGRAQHESRPRVARDTLVPTTASVLGLLRAPSCSGS